MPWGPPPRLGHPSALRGGLAPASAEATELDSVLMGFFAGAEYAQTDVSLASGDKLVLYTDGLVERR